MEIQLYRALIGAGVKEQDASAVVDSLEREIRERVAEGRKELVTRADLAELKYDLLKWIVGLALAQFALLIGVILKLPSGG